MSILTNIAVTTRTIFDPPKVVLFYPERPDRRGLEFRLLALCGYCLTRFPEVTHDLIFRHDKTAVARELLQLNVNPYNTVRVNNRLVDIRKSTVASTWLKVSGAALTVDPSTYKGTLVEKSEMNATREIRFISGPLANEDLRPGYTYQRQIVTHSSETGMLEVIGVFVIGRIHERVVLKRRTIERQTENEADRSSIETIASMLTVEETEQLEQFRIDMGLDFGEVEVMRDLDGTLYVIDVNDWPFGPSILPDSQYRDLFSGMLREFEILLNGSSVAEDRSVPLKSEVLA